MHATTLQKIRSRICITSWQRRKKKGEGGETKGGKWKRVHFQSTPTFWEIHQEVIQIYPEKMSCFPESLCETECSMATCNDVQTL